MTFNITKILRKFTLACQPDASTKPTMLDKDQCIFIRTMVNDELDELDEATTIVDQMDALVDAIVYICDCANRHGMNLDPMLEIVHQANMRKVGPNGEVTRREDGKIMKPEGWTGPDEENAALVKMQQEYESFPDIGGPTSGYSSLLKLLVDIRFACGDNGKRMSDELGDYVRGQRRALEMIADPNIVLPGDDGDDSRCTARIYEDLALAALNGKGF